MKISLLYKIASFYDQFCYKNLTLTIIITIVVLTKIYKMNFAKKLWRNGGPWDAPWIHQPPSHETGVRSRTRQLSIFMIRSFDLNWCNKTWAALFELLLLHSRRTKVTLKIGIAKSVQSGYNSICYTKHWQIEALIFVPDHCFSRGISPGRFVAWWTRRFCTMWRFISSKSY